MLIRRTPHQPQRLPHLAVGENVEEGRLSKLDRECLPQRTVEDRVPGSIVEIGQDHSVLNGQRRWMTGTEVQTTNDQRDDHNYSSGNRKFPEFFPPGDRNFSDAYGSR